MNRALHLTNFASRKQHRGSIFSAMAFTPHWARCSGVVTALAPDRELLLALKHRGLPVAAYFDAYAGKLDALELNDPALLREPLAHVGDGVAIPVPDGATLCCVCPRPDSPKRTHACHLETLAPYLVRAGWRVVLYGAECAPLETS